MSNVSTIGLPGGSRAPCFQYASSWSSVTGCQPADLSACIWAANSCGSTYRPGNGAPGGGALITWYIRIGTDAVPGLPVAGPSTEAVDSPRLGYVAAAGLWCAACACLWPLVWLLEATSALPLEGVVDPPEDATTTTAMIATAASAATAASRRRATRRRRSRARSVRRLWSESGSITEASV